MSDAKEREDGLLAMLESKWDELAETRAKLTACEERRMEERHYIEMVTAEARDYREYHEAALRREQSARLWSAMQAVIAVVALDVLYTDFVNAVAFDDAIVARNCRERLRLAAERAGWLTLSFTVIESGVGAL